MKNLTYLAGSSLVAILMIASFSFTQRDIINKEEVINGYGFCKKCDCEYFMGRGPVCTSCLHRFTDHQKK